jgi:hypothetical protein
VTNPRILTALMLCGYLTSAESARANAVVDWNAIAIQTITATPLHPGATVFLDGAIVQAAVYDAVVAIDGRFQPYHVVIPGATGSPAAAAAKAAHDVLIARSLAKRLSWTRPTMSTSRIMDCRKATPE